MSSCLAYSAETGEEFVAVGTSNGSIYRIDVGAGGASFVKDNVHTINDQIITGMAACPKARVIAVITGEGQCCFLKPKDGNSWSQIKKDDGPENSAALTIEFMARRSNNVFLVGYSNGLVAIFSASAHYKQVEI